MTGAPVPSPAGNEPRPAPRLPAGTATRNAP